LIFRGKGGRGGLGGGGGRETIKFLNIFSGLFLNGGGGKGGGGGGGGGKETHKYFNISLEFVLLISISVLTTLL